jgi:hypothetical protein
MEKKMQNPNGENRIEINIPCCDGAELNVTLRTKDNKPAAEAFKAIMKELGVEIVYNETKKGGGDG